MVGYKDTPDVGKKAAAVGTEKRVATGPWWVLSISKVK